MERDQLADEERVELLRGLPPGLKQPFLGTDEADGQPLVGQVGEFGQMARVLRRVGDDEIGPA